MKVDAELARLVARTLEFSEMSGGAFDVTYASVGYPHGAVLPVQPGGASDQD